MNCLTDPIEEVHTLIQVETIQPQELQDQKPESRLAVPVLPRWYTHEESKSKCERKK
jgi:hypothetical protein